MPQYRVVRSRSRFSASTSSGGGGGATVLFSDTFSSGNLNKTMGGASWTNTPNVTVLSGSNIPAGRSFAAKFDCPNGAELRFALGTAVPELYMKYDIYFPSGLDGFGPQFKNSGSNDKFFRLWGESDGDYGALDTGVNGVCCKVGASLWGMGNGDGQLSFDYHVTNKDGEQEPIGQGNVEGQWQGCEEIPFNIAANRGRWIEIKIRCKTATSPNPFRPLIGYGNGEMEMYADGNLVSAYPRAGKPALNNYPPGAARRTKFTHGYFLGAFNGGGAAGMRAFITNVSLSTGGWV